MSARCYGNQNEIPYVGNGGLSFVPFHLCRVLQLDHKVFFFAEYFRPSFQILVSFLSFVGQKREVTSASKERLPLSQVASHTSNPIPHLHSTSVRHISFFSDSAEQLSVH